MYIYIHIYIIIYIIIYNYTYHSYQLHDTRVAGSHEGTPGTTAWLVTRNAWAQSYRSAVSAASPLGTLGSDWVSRSERSERSEAERSAPRHAKKDKRRMFIHKLVGGFKHEFYFP